MNLVHQAVVITTKRKQVFQLTLIYNIYISSMDSSLITGHNISNNILESNSYINIVKS